MYFQDVLDREKVQAEFIAQKVLFIFAHPDDEQYMAGTIQKFLSLGHTVYTAYTTSGYINGTDVTGTYTQGTIAFRDAREAEVLASLLNLGVSAGNIIPMRFDANATDVALLYAELTSRLTGAGFTDIDCVITFDYNGVYTNSEHEYCSYLGIELYKQTASITNMFHFTIPTSDIDPVTDGDLTLGNSIKDNVVDSLYTLSSGEVTKKQDVIDYHVTQYAEPNITNIKTHFANRPFEYFTYGIEKLNNNGFSNREYLRMLFGG